MQISISDPIFATQLFSLIFFIALLVSQRRKKSDAVGTLSIETTNELKGFAIIAILFAHIGYYLAADHRFLFPLSVLAGVGVDLFLFLSGFGLATSALMRPLSIQQFYTRRLAKIYVPLALSLAIFFSLDFLILHKTYGWLYTLRSFLGYFPSANLYTDINSPLWYITLIVFYYLLFPVIFSKKRVILSALGIYAVTYALSWWPPIGFHNNMPLYAMHFLAFPLGILRAVASQKWPRMCVIRNQWLYVAAVVSLIAAIAHFAIHSGVGKGHWIAEGMSIFTVFLILTLFTISRHEFRLFSLFGVFSFEIYLLHWPILYRYDMLFKFLPAWLAAVLYLPVFIGLAWLFSRGVQWLDTRFSR